VEQAIRHAIEPDPAEPATTVGAHHHEVGTAPLDLRLQGLIHRPAQHGALDAV